MRTGNVSGLHQFTLGGNWLCKFRYFALKKIYPIMRRVKKNVNSTEAFTVRPTSAVHIFFWKLLLVFWRTEIYRVFINSDQFFGMSPCIIQLIYVHYQVPSPKSISFGHNFFIYWLWQSNRYMIVDIIEAPNIDPVENKMNFIAWQKGLSETFLPNQEKRVSCYVSRYWKSRDKNIKIWWFYVPF